MEASRVMSRIDGGGFAGPGSAFNRICVATRFSFSKVFSARGYLLYGVVIGWFCWGRGSGLDALLVLLMLPFGWGLSSSRLSVSMLMGGYYLASARGLPAGTAAFFGGSAPSWIGWVFWFVACALLTMPYVVLWAKQSAERPWRFAFAVLLAAIPPLGLIGWVSPLAVAGALYPGFGWVGLILALGAMSALVARSRIWVAWFAVLAVIANVVLFGGDVRAPTGWSGVNTSFPALAGGQGDDAGQILAAMQRIEWVKRYVDSIPANSVRVLPETVLGSYSGVAQYSLMGVDDALASRGSRLLVGAGIPLPDGRYLNSLVVLGSRGRDGRAAVQSIPVPVAMWKPWVSNGAKADVFGHGGIVEVKGVRAGVLICYEQLLAFSVLKIMMQHPMVLVGAANVWWVQDASIPMIQKQLMGAFGRLFGVAVVGAFNY